MVFLWLLAPSRWMCWPLFIAAPPVNTRCVEGPIYSKPPPCVCTQNTLCSGLLIAQNTKHRRKHKHKTKTRSHNSQSPPVCKHKTCCAQELTQLEASFLTDIFVRVVHTYYWQTKKYNLNDIVSTYSEFFRWCTGHLSIALYWPSAYLTSFL